jgi:hypothetical protein
LASAAANGTGGFFFAPGAALPLEMSRVLWVRPALDMPFLQRPERSKKNKKRSDVVARMIMTATAIPVN